MEFLKKLNEIDIKDLKHFNIHQLKENILRRKDIVINLAIVGVSIAAVIFIVKSNLAKARDYKETAEELKKRISVVKTLEKNKKNINNYIKELPEMPDDIQLTNIISTYAAGQNIVVKSFSPVNIKTGTYTTTYNVNIEILADNYQDMVLFIKQLEGSDYTIKIQSWVGRLGTHSRLSRAEGAEPITANIAIESARVHND